MPEHAAGSHTFNDVFGTTSNPHDLSRTAGGSSCGSAAALAVGAAWLATGNDLGGSLRNPAAFCGVVGLRPSPGRCSMSPPPPTAWRGRWGVGLHGVQGPLARSVCDLALLLDALAPLSDAPSPVARHWQESCIPELPPPPRNGFLAHVRQAVAAAGEGPSASDKVGAGLPSQIAWSANLGGLLKGVHPEIAAAVQSSALLLAASCGEGWAAVKNAAPAGLSGAHEAFKPLRFSRNLDDVAGGPGKVSDEYIAAHGNTTKPEILWEFEQGKADGWQRRVAEAEHSRQEIEANFCRFLEVFDILVCPCTLMPPFDKSIRYPATYEPAPAAGAPKAHGRLEMPDSISWMLPGTGVPGQSSRTQPARRLHQAFEWHETAPDRRAARRQAWPRRGAPRCSSCARESHSSVRASGGVSPHAGGRRGRLAHRSGIGPPRGDERRWRPESASHQPCVCLEWTAHGGRGARAPDAQTNANPVDAVTDLTVGRWRSHADSEPNETGRDRS